MVDTSHLIKSICFSPADRSTGVKVLNKNKICVLNNFGSLLEIVSESDLNTTRQSSMPQIKLNRKNIKTPVGGLLTGLVATSSDENKEKIKEKIKINNQQLSDLLYLPGKGYLTVPPAI